MSLDMVNKGGIHKCIHSDLLIFVFLSHLANLYFKLIVLSGW
jgi:hypothetical protein